MPILILAVSTLTAWAIHAGLVSFYINKFDSTNSLAFRATHAIEISLTLCVMLWIYLSFVSSPPSTLQIAGTILGTLLVVDLVAWLSMPSLKNSFDLIHFVTAYLAVALVAIIIVAINR